MKHIFSSKLACIALTLLSTATLAGPMQDFETSLREAYGDYRAALFLTNSDQAGKAAMKLALFQKKWAKLAAAVDSPPPQYVDDRQFAQTLSSVSAIALDAAASVEQGKLGPAHEKLEMIREEIAKLHGRNGIIGFSDYMNAYHAQMEVVLKQDTSGPDSAGLANLSEDVAVLRYLAENLAGQKPPESDDPDYAPLQSAFSASVAAMVTAVHSGDMTSIKAAKAKLKPAYSKFFLKFG